MSKLMEIVVKEGLDETSDIVREFMGCEVVAQEWATKAMTIVVTDEAQTEVMAKARRARLFLKDERVKMEKVRKELKADIVKQGRAIDGIARHLKSLIEPAEKHLLEQENFIKIREAQRLDDLHLERSAILLKLGVDIHLYDLREMAVDTFDSLVKSTKESNRLKQEEAERLKAERVAENKAAAEEAERAKLENIRLKEEAKVRDDELAKAQQEKAESDRRADNAEESKAQAATEQKEAILSVSEQLLIARRAITNISQSTGGPNHACDYCMDVDSIANKAIVQIGGWLE